MSQFDHSLDPVSSPVRRRDCVNLIPTGSVDWVHMQGWDVDGAMQIEVRVHSSEDVEMCRAEILRWVRSKRRRLHLVD